jgi:hypothetical protein
MSGAGRAGAKGRSLALPALGPDVIMPTGARRSAHASLPKRLPTRMADAAAPGAEVRRDGPSDGPTARRAPREERAMHRPEIEGPEIEGPEIEGPEIEGSEIEGPGMEPWIRKRWV